MKRITSRITTITSKGQVTIPVEIRRRLGLEAGDQLRFEDDGTTVRIERHRTLSLDEVFASVTPLARAFTDEEIKEAVENDRTEHYRAKYERMGFRLPPRDRA